MPAAAVIPAPIAYAKVVAVKKLVVGFLFGLLRYFGFRTSVAGPFPKPRHFPRDSNARGVSCILRFAFLGFYFEEIRVFKAGLRLEYISME